ncbi:MAG TPA: prolipoprotein diacylglyceryl transferase family protein [Polyangiaceae bacterium]|nr:prolipoprotein diacylglyceryl transferase family protein [Polyangiaceae bacterium]
MAPLIPYVQIPDLTLLPARLIGGFPPAPVALKPFGTLVALGLYAGTMSALWVTRRRGVSERAMVSFLTWIVISSFFFAHVLDTLSYYPGEALRDPWSLPRLWEGLSSFGGFTGCVLGGVAWRFWHKTPILAYSDIVASCFPVSWTFGRLGCSIAHDHPGVHSDAWFAVRYPDGGRLDLGLLELVITVPLMLVFFRLLRKPRPWGFYAGVMCVYYAPLRFLLDFLRERTGVNVGSALLAGGDARYFALTPAQWGSVPLFALGVVLLVRAPPAGVEPPPVPARLAAKS